MSCGTPECAAPRRARSTAACRRWTPDALCPVRPPSGRSLPTPNPTRTPAPARVRTQRFPYKPVSG
ncbi:hypothetical protein ABW18_12500 [Gordonia jacobaea]|uniref:Uncharacterized protein n=1 Tax=Gordonia jacobaea TaxID=122202 RepID=A0ABR5IBY1_9ACTN|nr:hypothetical protein ABW18_12500 [Gordonia jacobaea]